VVLGTIGGGLAAALRDEPYREAALITFLVTLSGVPVAGIGSAFWGVVAGAVALAAQGVGRTKTPAGKDSAPACKIRLDARAGAVAATTSPTDPAASRATGDALNPSASSSSSSTRP
jgi:benzoate membrane transport protein